MREEEPDLHLLNEFHLLFSSMSFMGSIFNGSLFMDGISYANAPAQLHLLSGFQHLFYSMSSMIFNGTLFIGGLFCIDIVFLPMDLQESHLVTSLCKYIAMSGTHIFTK